MKNGDERDRVKIESSSDLAFDDDSCVLRKRQTIEFPIKGIDKAAFQCRP
jgi:hypothetical protein